MLLIAATVDGRLRRPRVGAEGAIWIHGWCRRILRWMRIRCEVRGELPVHGAVVCNHLSYLDILLMSAVRPFIMVAKQEVRGWPLLGWLTAQAGTVYVVRGGAPETYPEVNRAMAEAYQSGLPTLFFPEGTTTDGQYEEDGVMPFRRGLFHSVLNEGVPLRTAALCYQLTEANPGASVADDICWWGDAAFAPHMFRFLGLRGVRAQIEFGEEVRQREDRFILSATARQRVAAMYTRLADHTTQPSTERAGLQQLELV
ncbi:MAG: 1-acyl-sn-glycerol-3-phosphate acyltransferase [Acidobacteriota bacterium]|nr:1-acyl-sn-glycerol-3-phosphate acyltransferase [Acidobacteriota bacterium]